MKYKTEMEIIRKRLRGHVPDQRIGDIVQEIAPFKEEMIPELVAALGDGYFTFGDNATTVLAYMGDCQFVIPVLERLEERDTGDIKLRVDFMVNAALSATDKERQCITNSFITHLTKKRDKEVINYVEVVLAILDALHALNALENIRVKHFLLQELEKGTFTQSIYQKALRMFAEIDLENARAELQKASKTFRVKRPTFHISDFRVVTQDPKNIKSSTGQDFSIFTKDLTTIRPYAFMHENGQVYFFSQGKEENKWFAGKAGNFSEAFQVAIDYLETFFDEINSVGDEKQITEKVFPFLAILEQHIDFKKWGFELSYICPSDEPSIIFDSQWCRVRFQLEKEVEMHKTTEKLDISYGRLHAPNAGYIMSWDGRDHWYWHGLLRTRKFLHFLDGRSPEYLAENKISSSKGEEKVDRSRAAKKAKKLPFVERRMVEVAALWDYYGEKLFRFFDLENPEEWEKCKLFLKKYDALADIFVSNQALGIPEDYDIR